MLWFFVALLPSSNLYPINAYMAEHWLYLPSIGFFLLLAGIFNAMTKEEKLKIYSYAALAVLIFFYGYLTVRQNNYWQDPVAFYKRTLKFAPGSYRVYYNLGREYLVSGNNNEASADFRKAIEIYPDFSDAYNNLGYAALSSGGGESIALFKKAIDLDHKNIKAYENLGYLYASTGKNSEAIKCFNEAIEIDPRYANAYFNLGCVYLSQGENDKAVFNFKRAIRLRPDYPDAFNNLGIAYSALNRYEEAIGAFGRAVALDKTNSAMEYNLCRAYYKVKNYSAAAQHCDRAVSIGAKVDEKFLEELKSHNN